MTQQRPLMVVCDWIPPEFGAVGQYEMERALKAAAGGRRVTLIGLGRETTSETFRFREGELIVLRIAAEPPDKKSLFSRAAWALSKSHALLRTLSNSVKVHPACEIKVTGSPPFLAYLVIFFLGADSRLSITYRISDFYPETVFAAGKALILTPLTPIFHALRRRANRVEALSECQRRRLVESGVDRDRIEVVRDKSPVHFSSDLEPSIRPFKPEDLVLLYSGNLGVAHDWQSFAAAYKYHIQAGNNRFRLWLNATGVGVEGLKAFCDKHQLPVHVSSPVPIQELAGILLAADAHLILLGDRFWGYVFPSKVYGCLDSGKPCIFVGPAESDVNECLSADPRHSSFRQGDIDGIATALDRLPAALGSRLTTC